ncbi:hypothetical protein KR222_005386, partial [Zaprionus bogoriensis]
SPASKVRRVLYTLFANFAICIGATSYRYDFKRRRYRQTKWTQLIAGVANLISIGFLATNLHAVWQQVIKLNMVPDLTIHLDTSLHDVICLLRILQRFSMERATCSFARDLRHLQRMYRFNGGGTDTVAERRLERIFLLKNCFMWALLCCLLGFFLVYYKILGMPVTRWFFNYVLVVVYALAVLGQDATIQLHFLCTWRICRSFLRLDARIAQLLLLRSSDAAALLELQQLRRQHWQLSWLWQRLNHAYSFVLITSRLSLIMTAATLGYYISAFASLQAMTIGLYALIALDCYMLDRTYDLTVTAYGEPSGSLRQHNELVHGHELLDRGVTSGM